MFRLYYITLETMRATVIFLPVLWLALYFVFHRKLSDIVLESVFGCYILAVFSAVGFPGARYFVVDFGVNFVPFAWLFGFSTGYLLNMVLNVILFLPFGIFLPMMGERWNTLKSAVLAGFLFSLFIEIMQIFSFRTTDVDDLIMNTLGAAAGCAVWKLLSKHEAVKKIRIDCKTLELGILFVLAVLVKFFVPF